MSISSQIHPLADAHSRRVGHNTRIWQFVVVLPNARIGTDCDICSHALEENDEIIGDLVTVKSGVQLWDGLRIEDDVIIVPNVTFSNDRFPRSEQYLPAFPVTNVKAGASLGGRGDYPARRDDRKRRHGGRRSGRDNVRTRLRISRRQPRARIALYWGKR